MKTIKIEKHIGTRVEHGTLAWKRTVEVIRASGQAKSIFPVYELKEACNGT